MQQPSPNTALRKSWTAEEVTQYSPEFLPITVSSEDGFAVFHFFTSIIRSASGFERFCNQQSSDKDPQFDTESIPSEYITQSYQIWPYPAKGSQLSGLASYP